MSWSHPTDIPSSSLVAAGIVAELVDRHREARQLVLPRFKDCVSRKREHRCVAKPAKRGKIIEVNCKVCPSRAQVGPLDRGSFRHRRHKGSRMPELCAPSLLSHHRVFRSLLSRFCSAVAVHPRSITQNIPAPNSRISNARPQNCHSKIQTPNKR